MAVKGLWEASRPLDRIIVLLMLVAALSGVWWYSLGAQGVRFIIEQDGEVVYSSYFDKEGLVSIEGPLGPTEVAFNSEGAWVNAATCPQRFCMAMGTIARAGEVIACVPNRLLIRVSGDKEEGSYDFLSQ